MKFSIGEKVRIKTKKELGDINAINPSIVEAMESSFGKIVTIRHIDDDGDYLTKETENYYWSPKCFINILIHV